MTNYLSQPRRSSRLMALAAIAVVHIVAVYFWPGRAPGNAHADRKELAITFVDLAPKEPAVAPAQPIAVRAAPARRLPAKVAVPEPVAMTIVPAVQPPAPVETIAPVERGMHDIMDQAKLDVGKIDKELRKQRLDPGQRNTQFGPTKRERLIAAAMHPRGPLEQVETILPDGRRMTRVGNNCAVMESNSLVGARDVFKDGVKTKWSRCNK
ncbi:MAG: hypothetical protein V4633_24325 [Pseudomonadota bacterium]